jgi:DNA-binding NarL/FixJ family response regulator
MIAEDSGIFRELLAELLAARGFTVTGAVETKERLLELVAADPPDAVVLDIRLPPGRTDEGLQAAEEIRRSHPGVGLLVLSHYAETEYAVRLLEIGDRGVGYLVKDRVEDAGHLVDSLRRVIAGATVVDSEVVHRVMTRRREVDPLARLTPQERLVLSLMAQGDSNAAIARRLRCSPKTVEKHVGCIARKLALPAASDDARGDVNVRVLAVLTYLRQGSTAS